MIARIVRVGALTAAVTLAVAASGSATVHRSASPDGATPRLGGGLIQHVVIVYQENHSFDDVLGAICVSNGRCDGAKTGKLPDGTVIPLRRAPDLVPTVRHSVAAQVIAIDGGKMDGFARLNGCKAPGYACYQQYVPRTIPNLAALARRFAVSDRTFEDGTVPSWGSHLGLVAGQFDGFTGDNPAPPPTGGWGCDSKKDAPWVPPGGGPPVLEPSCIPKPDGSGPYRPSPVKWIPTIMDRFDDAGLTWEIDAPGPSEDGYIWATCPTFADCLYTSQVTHVKPSDHVIANAQAGTLPNLSIVIPTQANSQHNGDSMLQGDNWIGSIVSAIMNGPDWPSTAIFVTYDDCGCFYDHVAPPPGLGIRVPIVIVSPFAKRKFTDSNVAQFASMLAFVEHVFGVPPLAQADANAYDYSGSFNFAQRNLARVALARHEVPPAVQRWIRAHPPDPADPT